MKKDLDANGYEYTIDLHSYYNDVIMGTIVSQITSLTIVYSIVYSDADQRKIKAPRHWPLCGEFTADRWIPRTNGQLRGKCFHLMTSSWYMNLTFSMQIPVFAIVCYESPSKGVRHVNNAIFPTRCLNGKYQWTTQCFIDLDVDQVYLRQVLVWFSPIVPCASSLLGPLQYRVYYIAVTKAFALLHKTERNIHSPWCYNESC